VEETNIGGKDDSLPDEVMAEPNTGVVAVDVVDGFVLYSTSSPAKKNAAFDIGDIGEDLEEAAAVVQAAAATENVDVATLAAAVGHEDIAEFDSPGRGLLCIAAAQRQRQQADRMKKRCLQENNNAKEKIPVGGVVLIKIDKVDRSKLGNKRLACVVIEVTERGQYRIACKGGVLENVYLRQDLHYEEHKLPASYDLEEALQQWRSMDKVSIRNG
jgi:hypothetical protein